MTRINGASVSALSTVSAAVRDRFGVDLRALASMRIGLGVLLLVDLGLRARHLTTFYTDSGALPRATLAQLYPTLRSVSLHAISGDAWFQALLFLLAAVFAISMIAGYHTRLATIASLVLLVSLHARNPMVLNAGDVLFRRLLFWSIFLPLGSRWAIDARRSVSRNDWLVGLASAGLLIQVVLVYASNLPFKLRTDVWLQGDAIRYVVNLGEFTAGLAPLIAQSPGLLTILTWTWFALVAGSVLLLGFTGPLRTALVTAFAAGHLGMALTMDLGIFPFVSLVALVPFVHPAVWDWVERSVSPAAVRLGQRVPQNTRALQIPFGRRARVARSTFLAVLIVALLAMNLIATGIVDAPEAVPDAVEDRSWNMFGNPPQADGWYVANATLADGTQMTVRVDAARLDRPPDDGASYPNARWRKYQDNFARMDNPRLGGYLAVDLCRRMAATGHTVQQVRLEQVREQTNFDGAGQRESWVVDEYGC